MNKTTKILTRSMAAAALIMGWGACTDDYFDVESATEGGNATESLWELIQKNPNLSDFAEVCKAAKFYTNEYKPSTGYTFKDLLDGQTVLTVYAPVNGTFNKDSLLALAENEGYKLQNQFMANHIVRFRHEFVGNSVDSVVALNSKWSVVDNGAQTYRGVHVAEAYNYSARNGVLHTIKEPAKFNYSLYEYLRDPQGYDLFSAYFMTGDTASFNASASIPGDVIEGQTHYMDSVFYNTNRFFYGWYESSWKYSLPGMYANLASEDSSFVMIVPSDAAYTVALDKFKKWMTYASVYPNNTARSAVKDAKDQSAKATFTVENPDSLRDRFAPAYLMRSLVFNTNTQKGGPYVWNIDNFDAKVKAMTGANATDYLVNTVGDTLRCLPYTALKHGENDIISSDYADGRVWTVGQLLNGQTPKVMSNGLAYLVNKLDMDFIRTFKSDVRIEAENYSCIFQGALDDGGESQVCTRPVDSIQAKYGKVSGQYRLMYKKAGSRNEFNYKLGTNILAGKYDIFVVTVPYIVYAGEDEDNEVSYEFYTELNYVDTDGKEQKLKSETFTTKPLQCDTVLIFKDFEFPVAYMHLEDAYPTLYFRVSAKNTKNKLHNNMCIDFIYLKAKED